MSYLLYCRRSDRVSRMRPWYTKPPPHPTPPSLVADWYRDEYISSRMLWVSCQNPYGCSSQRLASRQVTRRPTTNRLRAISRPRKITTHPRTPNLLWSCRPRALGNASSSRAYHVLSLTGPTKSQELRAKSREYRDGLLDCSRSRHSRQNTTCCLCILVSREAHGIAMPLPGEHHLYLRPATLL